MAIVSVVVLTVVIIGVGIGLANGGGGGAGQNGPPLLHGGRGIAPSGTFNMAAVATDGKPCATVGV